MLATVANAGTYYVSPSGSASWAQATNSGTPCSISTAMSNAIAGDTVYFRGGTYIAGQSNNNSNLGYWNPSNSGTASSPITFKAYPGETPIMDAYVSGTYVSRALGNGYKNYIIFDGFTLKGNNGATYGSLVIAGTDMSNKSNGCVVRNCTFIGASTDATTTDNVTGLALQDSINTVVEKCKFSRYNHRTDYHNTSAIKMYHNDYTTIQNCEIYDSTVGIYDKSTNQYSTYRYNYIHDCARAAIEVTAFAAGANYNCRNGQIYHNVFSRNGYVTILLEVNDTADTNDWKIYNNTFYNNSQTNRIISLSTGTNRIFYNNIIIGNTTDGMLRFVGTYSIFVCDHNQFGPSYFNVLAGSRYTTLSSWKASGALIGGANPETGSLASDPRFVNSSGSMSTLDDFRLASNSPCKGAGREGVDMGANISLVGVGSSPDTIPPAKPTGISVQVIN
jgi:hypothetical protein